MNIRIARVAAAALVLGWLCAGGSTALAATQQDVADFVRDNVLGGSYDGVNLWMTSSPLDQSFVARDVDSLVADVNCPYPQTWVVFIDDSPRANFGHPCRWLFVNDDLLSYTPPVTTEFPISIWANGGLGLEEPFDCAGVTPEPCPASLSPGIEEQGGIEKAPLEPGADKDCLYAVLVSGGGNNQNNHARYAKNLRSMYNKLRACGFPKANISVYYADGTKPLDLDNDGANDVTDAPTERNIRRKIRGYCANLRKERDVLFIYFTNHGVKKPNPDTGTGGLLLWDFNGNKKWNLSEVYTAREFQLDTERCNVCRLFVVMDQCYSGQFTGIVGDGLHGNTSIYTAASADEPSLCRQYMSTWEGLDPSTQTADQMHAATAALMAGQTRFCAGGANFCEPCTMDAQCPGSTCIQAGNSTPQSAHGTAGNGNVGFCFCWAPVAVAFSQFEAVAHRGAVELSWDVYADEPFAGFRVYRADGDADQFIPINASLLPPSARSFRDATIDGGRRYSYMIAAVTADGGEMMSPKVAVGVVPPALALEQNHPNPFNPSTVISFAVPEATHVELTVYDARGHLVTTLWNRLAEGGVHEAEWDGTDASGTPVASGVYSYRLRAGNKTLTRKMVLLK